MLRACVLDLKGNWDDHFALTEFAYNNSFQSNIGMAPYEALYGRPYRAPQCWAEVSPIKGLMRFKKKGKPAPHFVRPFEILDRVGAVAYRLALPISLVNIHNVFHISMLKKYMPDKLPIVSCKQVKLTDDASYTEEPIRILDYKEQVLRTKMIPLVKVIWSHNREEEVTWEREVEVKEKYPHLFGDTS
ncbi:uncharacterized protein LOC131247069 [Magnolia sinica]|uniref:uncharacterized protein LOC131247069 n=1 Tax=Magnolia sinica TaxID=86752 RepID=UPI002658E380|nr:uncharacterized protein LOC131247069 [Magnolia sinica]